MYIIREDKDGGRLEVGYYLPDGSFYSEQTYCYDHTKFKKSSTDINVGTHDNFYYAQRDARYFCHYLNGGG